MNDPIESTKLLHYANNSLKLLSQKFKVLTELVSASNPEIALLRLNRITSLLDIALLVMERNLSDEEWQELVQRLSETKATNRLL